jgi:hypothetical protein
MAREERTGKGGGQRGAPHGGRGRKVSGKRRRHNTPPHREERPKNRPLLLDSAAAAVVFVRRPAPGLGVRFRRVTSWKSRIFFGVWSWGLRDGGSRDRASMWLCLSLPPVLRFSSSSGSTFSASPLRAVFLWSLPPPLYGSAPLAPPVSPLPVETFYRLELTAAALSNPKS